MAALRIVPVISKHGKPIRDCIQYMHVELLSDVSGEIVADSLQVLLKATTHSEDAEGTIEKFDDIFHIEVLKTLSDLAKNGLPVHHTIRCVDR